MKHTDPAACLTCDLLKFIRDSKPTESQLASWLGSDADVGRYHVLRKANLLFLDDTGRIVLSPNHLSPDGSTFTYGIRVYKIDDDVMMLVCRGPAESQDAK